PELQSLRRLLPGPLVDAARRRARRPPRKLDCLHSEPAVLRARCTMKLNPASRVPGLHSLSQRAAIERRTFLKALGSGIVALPIVDMLADSVAHAQDGQPLKFIGVYHPHGIAAEYWVMQGGDTETSFDITYENCSLQ